MSLPPALPSGFGDGGAVAGRGSGWAWTAVATALAVVLCTASFLGASALARGDARDARHTFEASAAQVSSTLQLAIEREEDLVVSARTFLVENPDASQAQFLQWGASTQTLARYPELSGLGLVVIVPAAGLPAFAARALTEPLPGTAGQTTYTVVPPGARSSYCLARLGFGRGKGASSDVDYCADPRTSRPILAARDDGSGAYLPVSVGTQTYLAVSIPAYTTATMPSTVALRRQNFIGWLGVTLVPSVLLDRASLGHRGVAVSMRYDAGASDVDFISGSLPGHPESATVDLHNGWTVTISATARKNGVLADATARSTLASGVALSLLLALLTYILGTGRGRTLRLVRRKTGELRHLALHDALTGLANRAQILDRIDHAMTEARRDSKPIALMFLDLDDFKNVNDTFGHAAGDQFLQAVANRLVAMLRVGDVVARLGGDEFVILLDSSAVTSDPPVVAERIRAVLAEPFVLPGVDMAVHAQVSIGIAIGVRATAEELLRDADVALYEAKSAGKNRYVVFATAMQTAVHKRLQLKTDLRDSIGTDEFFLLYQPILDLRTLTVTSVEALLRWRHPTRGLVMPDDFIPAAEQSGLIVPLGRWVLFQACREAADRQVHRPGLGISVNVSAGQLDTDGAFLTTVREALLDSGLDPGLLTLEITETMLMRDAAVSAQRLHALKNLGVRIAIDDFGTGYSSIAYLQQFPVDILKIDRSFVGGSARTSESAALLRTLVQLGASLGIETVAEGIEDESQLHELQQEHCHRGQGYLFARPLSTTDLEPFLEQLDPSGGTRLLPAGAWA